MAIPFIKLEVDHGAIHAHVKNTPAALNELGADPQGLLQLGSQTGRPW